MKKLILCSAVAIALSQQPAEASKLKRAYIVAMFPIRAMIGISLGVPIGVAGGIAAAYLATIQKLDEESKGGKP